MGAVLAGAEHQRLALAIDGPLDAPEEDDVIAADDARLLAALEGGKSIVQERAAAEPRGVGDALELVRAAPGEMLGEIELPVPSTLTAKWPALSKPGRQEEAALRLHSTRGGSSETAEKELTVRPSSRPSGVWVVITVTPVTKRPSALRRWRSSNALSPISADDLPFNSLGNSLGKLFAMLLPGGHIPTADQA